ncbi:hypothetical protein VTK73DRAFT_5656 [Phialemonium thermophilum]|uniref:Uncharacterized protein n=1 Tax=Phialemonium thermophilum TaxID=223376 RepID=A0ABR3V0W1_9PEZI
MRDLWTPTQMLGRFCTDVAMGRYDGKLTGDGIAKLGDFALIENTAIQKLAGLDTKLGGIEGVLLGSFRREEVVWRLGQRLLFSPFCPVLSVKNRMPHHLILVILPLILRTASLTPRTPGLLWWRCMSCPKRASCEGMA